METMNESSIDLEKGSDESGRTHDEANVTPRESSSQGKGYIDDAKNKDRATSLKRIRDVASDSSLDDHNDGVPSTDASATNQGAPMGSSGGGVSDQMRLEERRAYNRRNAARSRQRVKDQLRDLQQQVIAHTNSRSELERTNVRLLAENNVLRDEVHKLRTILSGAPLFGQQQQSLQPFLQQPFGLGANTQFINQGVSQQPQNRPFSTLMENTTQQPTPQLMLPNASTQQQQQNAPFSFYPASAQNQMQQQDIGTNPQLFANQTTGDGNNSNQNAVVQLLLQQIMNNNNINSANNTAATNLSNSTGMQEPTLQPQQQLQQPQPQQQDNSLAAFMAIVGGGSNAVASSTTEGKSMDSLHQPSIDSLQNDGQQVSSSNQTGFALIQQQQFDQLNVSELQQSFLSQQQQQQQSYSIKEERHTDE
jgi:hypothetical protein